MKRIVVIAVAVMLASLAMSASASAAEQVYFRSYDRDTDMTGNLVEPESFVLSSGVSSGTFLMSGFKDWQNWGSSEAYALGIAEIKTCRPSCLTGGTKKIEARVTVSYIRSDICPSGKRYYMNVKVMFFDPKYGNSVWGPQGTSCQYGGQTERPYPHLPRPNRFRWKQCGALGTGYYIGEIKARGTNCGGAKRVLRKIQCANNRCSKLKAGRWQCKTWRTGPGTGSGKCWKGRKRIAFQIAD